VVGGSRGWNEDCLTFPNNSHLSMTLVNGVGCLEHNVSHKTVAEAAGPAKGRGRCQCRVDTLTAGTGRPLGHRALQLAVLRVRRKALLTLHTITLYVSSSITRMLHGYPIFRPKVPPVTPVGLHDAEARCV
jgi:hypothetical protein